MHHEITDGADHCFPDEIGHWSEALRRVANGLADDDRPREAILIYGVSAALKNEHERITGEQRETMDIALTGIEAATARMG